MCPLLFLKASALFFTYPLCPDWQNIAWGLRFPSGLRGEQVLKRFCLRLARCILEVVNFGQIINLNAVVTIFKHKLSN
jgi:hypothetical protein